MFTMQDIASSLLHLCQICGAGKSGGFKSLLDLLDVQGDLDGHRFSRSMTVAVCLYTEHSWQIPCCTCNNKKLHDRVF